MTGDTFRTVGHQSSRPSEDSARNLRTVVSLMCETDRARPDPPQSLPLSVCELDHNWAPMFYRS